MKHFATEEWIDFVNQVATASQKAAMEKHLEQGCKHCEKTVSQLQRVRGCAAAEASYQPPADAVRLAKANFAADGLGSKQKKARGFVEVLFDSFLQPALQGARSAGTGTRQMLYRADPYQIDVQIEAKPLGNVLVVTGQMMDLTHPQAVGQGVAVTLSNLRGRVVHSVTNEFGEFRGEVENSGDLQLTFTGSAEKPISISLRDALGRLPGAAR